MDSPLVVFVAMPGTDMGPHAVWQNIAEIKAHLYDPIVDMLRSELGVEVDLRIEKDKISQGAIHKSMFTEALVAPVYIADLTGANPNVYLELGVRWSLRDNVTVLVCQDTKQDIKFNVSGNRAIRYGQGPAELTIARRAIADAILEGIQRSHIDSPVREGLAVVTVDRGEMQSLRDEWGAPRIPDTAAGVLITLLAQSLSDR